MKSNARPHLRELQEMETTCKVMSARAETQEYTADFQKYIAAHESKLKSAIKILNNIIEHFTVLFQSVAHVHTGPRCQR